MSLNVLLALSEFPPGPGGIGTHGYALACGLTELGWGVSVVSPQAYAEADEVRAFNARQAFPVVGLRSNQPIALALAERCYKLLTTARNRKPDLVIASGERMLPVVAALKPAVRRPIVMVEHGTIAEGVGRSVKRRSYRAADAVVAVSEYTLSALGDQGVRVRNARVIHNGAFQEHFRELEAEEAESARVRWGVGDGPVLLTVGHLSRRKAQDLVIRAMPRIRAVHPNVKYVLAGQPTLADEYAALAKECGVGDGVRVLGRVKGDELAQLLAIADVHVLTSRHTSEGFEGFGIAVVEAALCGTPSVVTANSGMREALIPGETGLVVEPESPEAIAQGVLDLLAQPGRLAAMGKRAREHALSTQTWSARVREYDHLLRGLVGGERL